MNIYMNSDELWHVLANIMNIHWLWRCSCKVCQNIAIAKLGIDTLPEHCNKIIMDILHCCNLAANLICMVKHCSSLAAKFAATLRQHYSSFAAVFARGLFFHKGRVFFKKKYFFQMLKLSG